jgi:hypothetical protein
MARILEGIFVLGCSLVGFSMNALEGSRFPDTLQASVQLVMNELRSPLKEAGPLAVGRCIELLIMKHVL